MSRYLRDTTLKNLTLKEENIREINSEFLSIKNEINKDIREDDKKYLKISYTIRFDQKGFLLYDFNEAMNYFRSAKSIERFIFELKSNEYEQSFKVKGKGIDVRFDSLNPNNCSIIIQDDEKVWTDSIFLRLKELIDKFKNKNYLARNAWIAFAIQILGVVIGLLLSLWSALKFSDNLKITYSFGFTFLIAFLLFSNIWTYLYAGCLKMVNFFWPNISFQEKGGIHIVTKKLVETIFYTCCIALLVWIGKLLFSFAAHIFKPK